ncbi:hypothetical protein SEES004_03347, partial [Salmonella enterica subsp. enterica serovar Senftenberg str. 361154004]
RFIPAGAGNTRCSSRRIRLIAVYPRWRGEHCSGRPNCLITSGLSPLARGTHECPQQGGPERRFIPAGAGNTYCGKPL